jgi:hypothetical protein
MDIEEFGADKRGGLFSHGVLKVRENEALPRSNEVREGFSKVFLALFASSRFDPSGFRNPAATLRTPCLFSKLEWNY